MAVPESKKKANMKWDRANMATVGCKIKKADAEAFRACAQSLGKTSNALVKELILQCIAQFQPPSQPRTEDQAGISTQPRTEPDPAAVADNLSGAVDPDGAEAAPSPGSVDLPDCGKGDSAVRNSLHHMHRIERQTMKTQFSNPAKKALQKMDKSTKQRIGIGIRGLTEVPPKGDIKAMQGESGGVCRLRVGQYRVIYELSSDRKTLNIIDIGLRGRIYK